MVKKMLDHAKVTPQDFVINLGSGGRPHHHRGGQARRARAGHRIQPQSRRDYHGGRRQPRALTDKAVVRAGRHVRGRHLESWTRVLALFLLPSNIEKLVPKFLELPPGTRIVANTFWVPEWTPDNTETLTEGCEKLVHVAPLFIVPAKVGGRWRVGDGVVELTPKFQMVEGTFTPATGASTPVKGRLLGNVITVSLGPTEYKAR